MNKPTLVVVAYNRQDSLNNLLHTLSRAEYGNEKVNLVISIDHSGHEDVYHLANHFKWTYGDKTVIKHEKNLGLRQHILFCGDLAIRYGSVIILEDDLLVAPGYYHYAKAALEFYKDNSNIAGISLYQHEHNESTELPFETIEEGYDTYFMQVPSSWGQLWTAEQWSKFKNWYDQRPTITESDYLPDNVIAWPESSWKKYFWKYLVETNTYFVFPHNSYTTNSGAVGEHHDQAMALHQSPLSLKQRGYSFPKLGECVNTYDQFFEIQFNELPWLETVNFQDVEIDIYGAKPICKIKNKYLLTSKVSTNPIATYNIDYFPVNLNVIQGLKEGSNENGHLYLVITNNCKDIVNSEFIGLLASRVDKKLKQYLDLQQQKVIAKTDAYRIGQRILRMLNWLPFKLGAKVLHVFR